MVSTRSLTCTTPCLCLLTADDYSPVHMGDEAEVVVLALRGRLDRVLAQLVCAVSLAELGHNLALDLADTLAGQAEAAADLV